MATLNTTNIKHGSSSSNIIVLASDGKVTFPQNTGNILQVVQAVKTDTQSNQTQTYVDVASLAPSITPASSSNKILICWSIAFSTNGYVSLRLKRDSDNTILLGDTDSSRERAVQGAYAGETDEAYDISHFNGMYLDSPSTTSAITYKPQLATIHHSSYKWYVNRSWNHTDANYQWTTTSTMTLMEVAA